MEVLMPSIDENSAHINQPALIVIDVQQVLFEKATPIYQAEQLLANINTLIYAARGANAPVIFVQHDDEKSLIKGSPGWRLHPQIQTLEGEIIINKHYGNAFKETNLRDELERHQVRTLVITGLVSQGCVRATCLGALEAGYSTILVSDAHSTYSKSAKKIIQNWNTTLKQQGATLLPTSQVIFDTHPTT
jgi:nicotinamidase-related amidase